MDSFCSTYIPKPFDSLPAASPALICPDCGNSLVLPEQTSYLTCAHCGEEHLVGISEGQICLSPLIPGLEGGTPAGDWRIPAMTIHQLKAEVKELQLQLGILIRHGGLIDLAGKTGFTAIFAGLGFAVLNGATNLPTLSYGFVGLLSGILLHSGSHLLGRDYYAQKDYLLEQIHNKQTEIERNQQLLSLLQS
jgi:hypothetical protein